MKPRNSALLGCAKFSFLLSSFLSVGFLVFSNTFQNSFHLDDFHTLIFNYHVHSLTGLPSFFISGNGFSGSPYVSGYRPVTEMVNALNYAVSQTSPFGYHLVNLVIHVGCSLLVYLIAKHLLKNDWAGILSGILFLVHPMNTEVVNYLSSRSSSLSALFYLASFWAFIHYREDLQTRWLILSLIGFGFSLLSKEIAITLPLILMAYDHFYEKKLSAGQKIGIYFIYFFLAFFFLIARDHFMTLHAAKSSMSFLPAENSGNSKTTFLGSIFLSTRYLLLFLFPAPLSADHPFPNMQFDPFITLSLIFWIFVGLFIVLYRQQRTISFLICWFLITLLPVFLLPAITTISIFQENRGYLSGAGPMILVISLAMKLKNYLSVHYKSLEKLLLSVLVLCFVFFSFVSYFRNQVWKNEITLWTDAYQKNPHSFIVNFSLGYGYLIEHQLDHASYFFNRSLALDPSRDYLYYIHNNLGTIYYRQENREKAFQEYFMARSLSPHLPEAHINLGLLYLVEGLYQKAGEELGSEIDPEYTHMEKRVHAAIEIEKQGETKVARSLLIKISNKLPDRPEFLKVRDLVQTHLSKIDQSKER